jgi:alkylation response protein AidB-like acyl-CoA dehydrogenase
MVGRDLRSGELRAAVTSSSAEGLTVAPTCPGLALGAAQLASVSFDAAALTASVQRPRLLVASAMLGTALRATEYAAKYATDRVAFGRPKASFQGVSFPLAESLMRIEASRLQVADLVTSQGQVPAECLDQAVSEAIAYASTVAVDAARHSVQSLGGHGFMEDHPVELWYRAASTLAALDFDPACVPFEPAL